MAEKILIVGANRYTGTILCEKLSTSSYQPIAMIRKEDQQKKFEDMNVKTVVADLESDFQHALNGVDKIIFAAGSGSKTGPDKTILVDREAAIKMIDLAKRNGIQKFVMLSAMNADNPDRNSGIGHYLEAKSAADKHLQGSMLNYSIVRPGRLTHNAGTGKVKLAKKIEHRGQIPREDVAEVLIACLSVPATGGKTFEILSGETPVQEALIALKEL